MEAKSQKLKDDSPMPDRGKYEGVKMINIPANHLIFLFENEKCSQRVRLYIQENWQALLKEARVGR